MDYGLNDNLMTISFDISNDLKLYLKLGRDVCSVIIVAIFKCLSRWDLLVCKELEVSSIMFGEKTCWEILFYWKRSQIDLGWIDWFTTYHVLSQGVLDNVLQFRHPFSLFDLGLLSWDRLDPLLQNGGNRLKVLISKVDKEVVTRVKAGTFLMVWLDYETNDNLSTICRQIVYNLS